MPQQRAAALESVDAMLQRVWHRHRGHLAPEFGVAAASHFVVKNDEITDVMLLQGEVAVGARRAAIDVARRVVIREHRQAAMHEIDAGGFQRSMKPPARPSDALRFQNRLHAGGEALVVRRCGGAGIAPAVRRRPPGPRGARVRTRSRWVRCCKGMRQVQPAARAVAMV